MRVLHRSRSSLTTSQVHTPEGAPDIDAAFAAGYLEGATTMQRSWEYLNNAFGSQTYGNGLGDFLHANFAWVRAKVDAHPGDEYWHHVGLVHTQFDGLYAGYSAFAPADQALGLLAFYSATLSGDLDDLNKVFPQQQPQAQRPGQDDSGGDGHCSVLIKTVAPHPGAPPSDLLASHTTWSGFNTMTRVFKLYDFPWTVRARAHLASVASISSAVFCCLLPPSHLERSSPGSLRLVACLPYGLPSLPVSCRPSL